MQWIRLVGVFLWVLITALEGNLRAQTADLFPTTTVREFPKATIPFTLELAIQNNAAPGVVASGVMVTNTLPSGLTFISCTVAPYVRHDNVYDGSAPYVAVSSTNVGNVVICDAGNIPNGFYRPISITVVANQAGIYTNQVTVRGNQPDHSPGNNLQAFPVTVHANGLAVLGGRSISESAGSNATFVVELLPASSNTVSVNYTTLDGTAISGQDYQTVSGTLVFPPGVTNQEVSVPILDDLLEEADSQDFTLQLSNAANASISGMAESNFILDDEPGLQIVIEDPEPMPEGETEANLVFSVAFDRPADVLVYIDFAVTGAATNNGTLIVPAGATNHSLAVPFVGDLDAGSNRTVQVTLSSPWPLGTLTRATAQGIIIDNDGNSGEFDHMEISTVPSPQIIDRPFLVTVFAKDAFGNPATNYTSDTVDLFVYKAHSVPAQVVGRAVITNFVDGVGFASISSSNTATNAFVLARKRVGYSYVTAITPSFQVVARPSLFLSLPVSAVEGNGVLVGAGQVSITNSDVQDVVVQLASTDLTEVVLPASVVIPAGQTSAVFDITVVDDELVDASMTAGVHISALGYLGYARSITIHDNEAVNLSVVLPGLLSEVKEFSFGQAAVTVSPPPANAVLINLLSSDTTELTLPCCVVIQAGQTSAVFNVGVPNDLMMDGPQEVTVTAHVQNWIDGVTTTTIFDNTNLTLNLLKQSSNVMEGSGTLSNALQVRIAGTNTNDIVVSLSSSDATEATVLAEVIIPAGQFFVNTDLVLPDDSEFDGNQSVTLTATAPNLAAGMRDLTVNDNDVHHFVFDPIPQNRTSEVPFAVSILLKDVNDATMLSFQGTIALAAARQGTALPITPTLVSNIIRGRWTGNVTVFGTGTNVQLTATASSGNSGQSNPFTLHPPAWAANLRLLAALEEGGLRLSFNTMTGKVYQVHSSTNLPASSWSPLGSSVPGNGSVQSVTDPAPAGTRFYRLTAEP